ncbi:hypothetical protein EDD73_1349 [Heliophilum fasciatum]|uniref:Uncharacterized protein n=1 Tax=Heliophilum fasciatum TaxID=35700 RepID=A0A4R2RFC9_9FIRM|nr:hypothetical protein [Heliophilum fasciatum]TCP60777.1 hypothetical protein EDD73_1349 [Heliophilum fasciatum]
MATREATEIFELTKYSQLLAFKRAFVYSCYTNQTREGDLGRRRGKKSEN